MTLQALQQLSLRLPVVCPGGALTKSTDGETLHSDPFTVGQVGHLLALARNRRQALILQRDADGGTDPDFVVDGNAPWNEPTRHYVDVGGDSGSQDARLEDAGHDDILVVGAFGEREGLRALQGDIAHAGEFATTLVECKRTPGWYLETTLGHVNKWSAIRRLAVAWRIDPHAICAVGDAANDLPMIRGAAFTDDPWCRVWGRDGQCRAGGQGGRGLDYLEQREKRRRGARGPAPGRLHSRRLV